jgi:prepilin-type N-terminal cleavage/methylation domain-containing protein/prepilin-type processing-associated H-X9-DG protein
VEDSSIVFVDRPNEMRRGRPAGTLRRAFTLIELLVVIAIIAILAALLLPALSRSMDSGKSARCRSNLHQVGFAYHFYNDDHNNHLPTSSMLGRSYYRRLKDNYGLPGYFKPYIPTNSVWLCPAGNPMLRTNDVNYFWTLSADVVSASGSQVAFNRMALTAVMWDNYCFQKPSDLNQPEPTTGPAFATMDSWYYPHSGRKLVNTLYLDGHVQSGKVRVVNASPIE